MDFVSGTNIKMKIKKCCTGSAVNVAVEEKV